MNKILSYTTIVLLLVTISCQDSSVTNRNEYTSYVSQKPYFNTLFEDLDFWNNKLKNNPSQYPYLSKRASAYTKAFNATGNIEYLIKAEKDLIEANKITAHKNAGYLKSLASNYISQHRFKEALVLLKKAEDIGEKLNGTQKMLFDTHLELGNYFEASVYLNSIKNTSDFDYLIRLAKWEDHNGNLENAIIYMEKATKIAESSNLKNIKQWAYTNLADFYGHAGKIEESYRYFLKSLELYPNDAYAKKGIAWIVYSHEKNPDEALRILNQITSYYNAPDYDLLKAEIAEYKGDNNLKNKALQKYRLAVNNNLYGSMYNKHNVMDYTEDLIQPQMAITIAKKEVENRPTPQSYDLLAWSYFKNGNIKKATTIIDSHVEGKTFEPEVLYHVATIYKAAGKTDQVLKLKEELVQSLYELGPTMTYKINQL